MVMPDGTTRLLLLYVLLITVFAEDNENDQLTTLPPLSSIIEKMMPSNETGEKVGLRFLDAVIKRGQLEMAKQAYKTQLAVLERTQPEKYERLKEIPVDEMALGAVRQQVFIGQFQPSTGNKLFDVLNRNGIPVASSIKSIQQAVKKQEEVAKKDPNEMIAEAVVDKLRKQLIPNLVASLIAGDNPFEKLRQSESRADWPRRSEARPFNSRGGYRGADYFESQPYFSDRDSGRVDSTVDSTRPPNGRLLPWAPSQPLIPDEVLAGLFSSPSRSAYDRNGFSSPQRPQQLSPFAQFANLQNALQLEPNRDIDRRNKINADVRRNPRKLSPELAEMLRKSPQIAEIMNSQPYFTTDVERKSNIPYLAPRPPGSSLLSSLFSGSQSSSPNAFGNEDTRRSKSFESQASPLSEFIQKALRSLPKLPNMFGTNSEQATEPSDRSGIWAPQATTSTPSYFLNPFQGALSPSNSGDRGPFFAGVRPDDSRSGMDDLIPNYSSSVRRSPRRPSTPSSSEFFVPQGRHTRLRITGATEEGNPGVNGQFVLPSTDPTAPAFNTMLSSQERTRQEYTGTLKLPNEWLKGDSIGVSLSKRSRKVSGGVGDMDLPGFKVDMDRGFGHV